jgi:hypothetical protein
MNVDDLKQLPKTTPVSQKPDTKDTIAVDGDRIIAFINAVDVMNNALRAVNILGIADLFIKNRQDKTIDDAIALAKKWNDGLHSLQHYTDNSKIHLQSMGKAVIHHRETMAGMIDLMDSKKMVSTMDKIIELNKILRDFQSNMQPMLIICETFMGDDKTSAGIDRLMARVNEASQPKTEEKKT